MTARDRRFVAPTWGHSALYRMPKRERFRTVDRILDRGARVVCIAEGITVHAWACGEDDLLHFAYVPPELRGEGFARRAIAALFGQYPEHVNTSHPWPFASNRFRFVRDALLRKEAA